MSWTDKRRIGLYILEDKIADGAMGEIYKAQLENSDEIVAMKIIGAGYLQDETAVERFRREIKLLAMLQHPHIIPILDFGIVEGVMFYTMKFVNGQTLYEFTHQRRCTPQIVGAILQQLCSALDYGHQRQIVHRDLKPENVFLEWSDSGSLHCYLGDFGLAKRPNIDPNLTETGIAVGTEYFISPEAIRGYGIDHRSDLYSLAVMTYEMLLGLLPFDKDTPQETVLAQIKDPPPLPCSLHPQFPTSLQTVLLHGLEKEPDKRPQSAGDFYKEYEAALQSLSAEQQQQVFWVSR